MISTHDLQSNSVILMESDNCSAQYKSVSHFHVLQILSDVYEMSIIRIYGIAGHGKGEVDHMGGIAKICLRREIATGTFMSRAADMVTFLKEKFHEKSNPFYIVKEIDAKKLAIERANKKLRRYNQIVGSSNFHVMVFKPNSEVFYAAPYICLCALCMEDYGTCKLFEHYSLTMQPLNECYLRSDNVSYEEAEHLDTINDFYISNTIVAIAASESSSDTMCFVKITDECEMKPYMMIMATQC